MATPTTGDERPPARLPTMQRVLLALFVILWTTAIVLLLIHPATRH